MFTAALGAVVSKTHGLAMVASGCSVWGSHVLIAQTVRVVGSKRHAEALVACGRSVRRVAIRRSVRLGLEQEVSAILGRVQVGNDFGNRGTCRPNMWRKLLYSGFETCFGPCTQGAGIRYQNTSRIQILRHSDKKGRDISISFTYIYIYIY